MSTLLMIPRELRDEIINIILTFSRIPPQTPELEEKKKRGSFYDRDRTRAHMIKYLLDPSVYTSDAVNLLLVNKQLHIETSESIRRHPNDYKIDIMVVRENELWPTWTYIPPSNAREVDTIYATFRIMGPCEKEHTSGFENRGNGPPPVVWALNTILERFLAVGAAWLLPSAGDVKYREDTDRGMTIKTIQLDFVTPACSHGIAVLPQGAPIVRRSWNRWVQGGRIEALDPNLEYVMSAQALADFVYKYLVRLTDTYGTSYGQQIHDSVHRLRLGVDGKAYKELDLASVRKNRFGPVYD